MFFADSYNLISLCNSVHLHGPQCCERDLEPYRASSSTGGLYIVGWTQLTFRSIFLGKPLVIIFMSTVITDSEEKTDGNVKKACYLNFQIIIQQNTNTI